MVKIYAHTEVVSAPVGVKDSSVVVQQCLEAIVEVVSPCVDGDDVLLSVKLSDDAEVQAMNRDFRGFDKPTNVLSFPVWDEDPDEEKLYLGDIIIARETLEREAGEQSVSVLAHLQHLIIHGVLHLFGFDHIEDAEAEVMEDLEIRILARLGVDNPYA